MDREKVIYDIERCICHVPDACRDCSHYGHGEVIGCMEELLTDALTLLKEQQKTIDALESDLKETLEELADKEKAQEPITPAGVYDNRDWDCGYCGYENPHENIYCGCCGHLKKV